jgi:hypothetical protein
MDDFMDFVTDLYSDKCEKWRNLRTDKMGDKVFDYLESRKIKDQDKFDDT